MLTSDAVFLVRVGGTVSVRVERDSCSSEPTEANTDRGRTTAAN